MLWIVRSYGLEHSPLSHFRISRWPIQLHYPRTLLAGAHFRTSSWLRKSMPLPRMCSPPMNSRECVLVPLTTFALAHFAQVWVKVCVVGRGGSRTLLRIRTAASGAWSRSTLAWRTRTRKTRRPPHQPALLPSGTLKPPGASVCSSSSSLGCFSLPRFDLFALFPMLLAKATPSAFLALWRCRPCER